MDQLTQLYSGKLVARVGGAKVEVRIQGLPEDVQRIADGVEAVFPGAMEWHSSGHTCVDHLIEIHGTGIRASDVQRDEFNGQDR